MPCDSAHAGALLETVVEALTRVPLRGAAVTATWREQGVEHQQHATTDSTGRATFCGPVKQLITMRSTYFDISSSGTVMLSNAGQTAHTLSLDIPVYFVRGNVVDKVSGLAVASAAVQLAPTNLRAVTNASGNFAFERVPVGDYHLRIEHLAYSTNVAALNVRDADLDASVPLTPAALPLAPITVTAYSRLLERNGFYERERRGIGTFINRKQIDKMNAQNASDLLRSVPGIRLQYQSARRVSSGALRNATNNRGSCRFRFIVDGVRMLPDFEMDNIAPYAMEGVEVYSGISEVPPNFRAATAPDPTTTTCGVIVIWTRNSR